jgi:hypothetical protein
MKKLFLLAIIFIVSSNYILGQKTGTGIGLMLGEPSGLSGKYWLSEETAFDFGLGGGFIGDGAGFAFHADYLYHINGLIKWKYKTPFYYGFGLRMRFPSNSSMHLGVRGVAGLIFYLKDLPIDLFFEVAPSFRLLPTTGIDFDIAIGSRYYFDFQLSGI